jgi:hypothetical protein
MIKKVKVVIRTSATGINARGIPAALELLIYTVKLS